MDFKYLYDSFSKLKFNCNITNLFKIKRIMFGSGGSSNIVIDVRDKNNNELIIKIIPDINFYNIKIKPDTNLLEIKFYQFFTEKYILTERTPHLVGIYNHQNCTRLDKLLLNIKPSKKTCPSYEDKLKKKINQSKVDFMICDLLLRHQMKILGPIFDVVLLEYCGGELHSMIEWYLNQIKITSGSAQKNITNIFISDLNRILFQIIFTLAIIKEDYPGFLHGDFFIRNILVSSETKYNDMDYIAYYYKQKIFYLPANGIYAKINDFGLTVIANELEPNTYEIDKQFHKLYNKNPFNEKSDIFNLLHDIYDGQNWGSQSIKKLGNNLKIPKNKFDEIRSFINNFIKVDAIDKINNTNKFLLDQTWDIDGIKILENSVRTPNEYLMRNIFSGLQFLPANANIVRHFNKPD
ncbi:putative serine threonine protein kinase [Tupanvirus deep ocean]|uniref:Serine threonine protein kinase n=2 Tax=Tupanvirus TaxID=2094720 RepID=A0AC62A7Q6_9VIRU|nr:putative serine threonine protein kinase [Tupanvirus deep ocean]QKU33786.1 putative serine threonine protein kinase [Tupanvirus deep ocean]